MAASVGSDLDEVLAQQGSPCLSLYQPIYRSPPEEVQNRTRYENLVKNLSASLDERFEKRAVANLISPLASLLDDGAFLLPTFDGLAVLACAGFMRVFKVHRPVPELALVADSFHIKPLIRILQSADRFQVLGISESKVRLFEGNRDALDEIEPGDGVPRSIMEALPEEYTDPSMPPGVDTKSRQGFGGPVVHVAPRSRVDAQDTDIQRFFRVVDRAVTHCYSRRSRSPLLLAALPQHQAAFRSVSENPYLLPETIDADPFALSADEMRKRGWELLESDYVARLQQLGEEFHTAKSNQEGSDDLPQVAEAAVTSRVRVLLLDESKHLMGRIDPTTGAIRLDGGEHDDIYDDLAEFVLRRGGEVIVAPSNRMPTASGVAGIFRY